VVVNSSHWPILDILNVFGFGFGRRRISTLENGDLSVKRFLAIHSHAQLLYMQYYVSSGQTQVDLGLKAVWLRSGCGTGGEERGHFIYGLHCRGPLLTAQVGSYL
jgi:hypothetical protein